MSARVRLSVKRVHADSSIEPGTWYEVDLPASVGRSAACDVQLDDQTVSYEHARIEAGPHGAQVVNLTDRSTTLLNRRRLEPAETARIAAGRATLQVGGVLLLMDSLSTTSSFDFDLADGIDESGPLVHVTTFGETIVVRLGGENVAASPRVAGALRILARNVGSVVSHSELLRAADPEVISGNPNQLVTYVRDLAGSALDAGYLDVDELRAAVERAPHAKGERLASRRGLLGQLVQNVRGAGYRLNLPPDEVVVVVSDP